MSSNREYLTQAELATFADITIQDTTEADNKISQSEEIIDEFVGTQDKFLNYEIRGLISSGGANNVTLDAPHQGNMQADYLSGCFIEIIGGTGKGQRKKITSQTLGGVITTESSFSPILDTTSYYRIWQLGSFPRKCDVEYDGLHTNKYYKSIPEKIRRAVAAQVEYRINMGEAFFSTDKSEYESERIGDYSYSKRSGNSSSTGINRLIAPKAKILLRGIKNITGSIL
jgi:hypothetical protein